MTRLQLAVNCMIQRIDCNAMTAIAWEQAAGLNWRKKDKLILFNVAAMTYRLRAAFGVIACKMLV